MNNCQLDNCAPYLGYCKYMQIYVTICNLAMILPLKQGKNSILTNLLMMLTTKRHTFKQLNIYRLLSQSAIVRNIILKIDNKDKILTISITNRDQNQNGVYGIYFFSYTSILMIFAQELYIPVLRYI